VEKILFLILNFVFFYFSTFSHKFEVQLCGFLIALFHSSTNPQIWSRRGVAKAVHPLTGHCQTVVPADFVNSAAQHNST
jgi:hypothetical protein